MNFQLPSIMKEQIRFRASASLLKYFYNEIPCTTVVLKAHPHLDQGV